MRQTLRHPPLEIPVRGPKRWVDKDFVYLNKWVGDINHFSGSESIFSNGKVCYKAWYAGGLVDVVLD